MTEEEKRYLRNVNIISRVFSIGGKAGIQKNAYWNLDQVVRRVLNTRYDD